MGVDSVHGLWTEADVVSSYSRAQAIEDGVLVDVSSVAREAGFKVPVALTRAVWEGCVEWTEEDARRSKGGGQMLSGRLWDVVWMARLAARRGAGRDTVLFRLSRHPRPGRGRERLVTLKSVIGPGDDGQPVITIMEPDED